MPSTWVTISRFFYFCNANRICIPLRDAGNSCHVVVYLTFPDITEWSVSWEGRDGTWVSWLDTISLSSVTGLPYQLLPIFSQGDIQVQTRQDVSMQRLSSLCYKAQWQKVSSTARNPRNVSRHLWRMTDYNSTQREKELKPGSNSVLISLPVGGSVSLAGLCRWTFLFSWAGDRGAVTSSGQSSICSQPLHLWSLCFQAELFVSAPAMLIRAWTVNWVVSTSHFSTGKLSSGDRPHGSPWTWLQSIDCQEGGHHCSVVNRVWTWAVETA